MLKHEIIEVLEVKRIPSCKIVTYKNHKGKNITYKFPRYVYDIEVEGNHNFFGSKILVHNSATPFKGADSDLLVESGFGRLQINMTPSDLIRKKRLSKPYIFFVDYEDTSRSNDTVDACHACGCRSLTPIQRPIGKSKKNGEYDVATDFDIYRTTFRCDGCTKEWTIYSDAIANCLVKNNKRNEAIAQLAAARVRKNRSVLILVNYIQHGQLLENRLKQLVNPEQVQFVQGATEDKKGLLKQLAAKEKLCLIATTVFGEGVDIPSLATLIYARASGSSIDVIQGVGRALRVSGSKRKTLVIDFQDKSDYLKSRSKFRYTLLKSEPEFVVRKIKLPTKYNIVKV